MAMPARVPDALRTGPFRGSDAVRSGLLSKRQLESGAWRRLLKDVYVHQDVELPHRMRCRAVAMVLPPGAAISGASAGHLLGADTVTAADPVEVTVPRELRMPSHPGVRTRYSALQRDDVLCMDGIPATMPVRTAFDLARGRGLDEAVVAVDALIYVCRIEADEIAAYAGAGRSRWHGVGRIGRVLALTEPGAESPMETRLRLALLRAGLPTPVLQHRVWDDTGHFVARLDLAYVEARLGVEYDGDCHLDPSAVRKDLRRQNALRALGWSLLRFTADDLLRHPTRMVVQVCAALGLPYRCHLTGAQ
ncbi:MAG TPA: DUF559 domain-containing protein [Terriglobales bacterium]|nr:DUF559 domain-containing protein [Terriglobales bacterium]